MHRAFVIVLLGSSFGLLACKKEPTSPPPPPVPVDPGPVSFGRQPWMTAERFVDNVSTSMERTDEDPVHTESRVSTLVEILDTDGDTINAVRAKYAEESDIDHRAGKGLRGPVHGKTFVVSFDQGELLAREAGDADAGVSPAEMGRLKSDFAWLGKPSPFRAAVQGVTLKYREPSVAVARALADTMTAGWTESTATASARYMGGDGGVAEFDVTVDQTMNESQPRRWQAKLTGTLLLRVRSGELSVLDLSGPLQFWEGEKLVGRVVMKAQRRRKTSEDFAAGARP